MNGEPEMISPVSAWRSGAPGGAVSNAMTTTKASSANPARRRPCNSVGVSLCGSSNGTSPP